MSIVRTDLRTLRESAREIRFYPTGPITATNVQDAVIQGNVNPPAITPTPVTSAQSPYNVMPTDLILAIDTSGGPVTVNMQSGSARSADLEVKDVSGNAATNPISVVMVPGQTADGLNPYPIDGNYGGATFKPNGSAGYFVRG